MENYLSMMMCICSIFLRMIDTDEAEDKREDIWAVSEGDEPGASTAAFARSVLNAWPRTCPPNWGDRIGITGYRLAQTHLQVQLGFRRPAGRRNLSMLRGRGCPGWARFMGAFRSRSSAREGKRKPPIPGHPQASR